MIIGTFYVSQHRGLNLNQWLNKLMSCEIETRGTWKEWRPRHMLFSRQSISIISALLQHGLTVSSIMFHELILLSCWVFLFARTFIKFDCSTLLHDPELGTVLFKFMKEESIIASSNLFEFNFEPFWKRSKLSRQTSKDKSGKAFRAIPLRCLSDAVFFGDKNWKVLSAVGTLFFLCSWGKDCLSWIGCLLNRFSANFYWFSGELGRKKWHSFTTSNFPFFLFKTVARFSGAAEKEPKFAFFNFLHSFILLLFENISSFYVHSSVFSQGMFTSNVWLTNT